MARDYADIVHGLSEALVAAQRPIRVLDAVQWDDEVRAGFLEADGREPPRVDRLYYETRRPLRFDPAAKLDELRELEGAVERSLGNTDPVARLLLRMAGEYRQVVEMLVARGTPGFVAASRSLYGTSRDPGDADGPDLGTLAEELVRTLDRIDVHHTPSPERTYAGAEAVALLQARLDPMFCALDDRVHVCVSDGIAGDAAAGADRIKLREDRRFTERELRLLEVHEGWVHVGTTLNGSLQRTCTFLSKGSPSSTVTQEGLAIFVEVVAMVSYPERVRKIANRTRALRLAEDGADFLDVVRFFGGQGFALEGAYAQAVRLFRGSTPDGGPFAKDLSYLKGFVRVQDTLERAVRAGRVDRLPLLFCGKVAVEDLDAIHALVADGVVAPPRYLPPQFADPQALTAWLCIANYVTAMPLAAHGSGA